MSKFKKSISIAAATCMVMTSITPAFAKVTSYVTEKDGVRYEYNKSDLINSIVLDSEMYKRYKSESLVALKDDVKGYIDANDVRGAIVDAALSDKILDVDKYTESDKSKTIEIQDTKEVDKDGNVVEKPEEGIKVESVSAINDTEITITFAADSEVTEESLKDVTITLTAGETALTATYKASTLTAENVATFELSGEDKLVDATTYTVSAEGISFTNSEFVAKVTDAYAKTFEKVTTDIIAKEYKSDDVETETKVTVKALDQYGEDTTLPADADVTVTAKLNGMPINTAITYSEGTVTIAYTLKEGDELEFVLTSKDGEASKFNYTVIKGEKAKLTKLILDADKDSVPSGKEIVFTAKGNDQYNSPVVLTGKLVWFVNGVKSEATGSELKLNETIPGEYKVQVFYPEDSKIQAEKTVTVGAAELTELTVTGDNADLDKLNNEEFIFGTITPNEGAALLPQNIKFNVTSDDKDITAEDITVTAETKTIKEDGKDKEVIVLKAKSTKAGTFKITPYVGTSFTDEKAIKGAAQTVVTTVNKDVASISDIAFTAKELKVGVEVKKDIIIKNKHGEVLTDVNLVTISSSNISVLPTENAKIETEIDENGITKTYLSLKAATAGTSVVTLQVGDIVKTYTLKFETSKLTSIDAGSKVTGVVAGDKEEKAKYNEIKFLDQDGIEIGAQISTVKVTDSKGQDVIGENKGLATLGEAIKDDKDNITGIKTDGVDKFNTIKVLPGSALDAGTYTVTVTSGEVSDSFTVEVGAVRSPKTVDVSVSSTKVGLNGKTTVTVTPEDQYGEFIAVGAEKIEVEPGSNVTSAAVTEKIVEDKVVGYQVILTGNTKGIADTTINVKDAEGKVLATNKVSIEVDSVAGLVNSVAIDTKDVKELYSTSTEANVDLKAIAKDIDGNVVSLGSSDIVWTVVSQVDDEGNAVTEKTVKVDNNGKVTIPEGSIGSAVIKAQTANLKSDTITLNFDKDGPQLVQGTLATVDSENKAVSEITLNGENSGITTVKLVGVDQYGKEIKIEATAENTTLLVDDSSVVEAKAEANSIKLTAKGVGTANVNIQYLGQTVSLQVSVDQAAVDAVTEAQK